MLQVGFCSPQTLKDALAVVSTGQNLPIAGGTDLLPAIRVGKIKPEKLVDLGRLDELRFIKADDSAIRIGALTTYQEIIDSDVLTESVPIIIQAAKTVGAQQTRNRGTIGGCLGNASPAADLLPPLMVLNAEVFLVSGHGERGLSLAHFLLGPGRTALQEGEIIHHVRFPLPTSGTKSVFYKVGKRAGMSCAIANLALVALQRGDGNIEDVRIAVGAVAPTAIRCRNTETILKGQVWNSELLSRASQVISQECKPIDDIRATAKYRRRVISVLLRRALISVMDNAS